MNRSELERALLSAPGRHDLRLEYASLLADEAEYEPALDQFTLVLDSTPRSAGAHLGRARCLHGLGRDADALDAYGTARGLDGFEPDPALDALAGAASARAPALRVFPGGGEQRVARIADHQPEVVRFSDVVGMEALKKQLRLQIVEPFVNPGLFQRFRRKAGGGVLLYGPPGCGKTMLARAIAHECQAQFMAIGISDVLSAWMGVSEAQLAEVFDRARASAPCVLFFDELDALAYSRSKSSSETSRTVVNEFLNQLDGFGSNNEGVLILAATNMPWDVDPAMKRPGRFSRQVFVPPPDEDARTSMLDAKLTGIPTEGADFKALSRELNHFSGADIDGLIEEAKDICITEILDGGTERAITMADFQQALDRVRPSTLDWLRTAKNLVKFGGESGAYKDMARYLKQVRLA